MGRLSAEIEEEVREWYLDRKGYLINISEWSDATNVSQQAGNFCHTCQLCMAGAPVVSLGEINRNLKNSGLFAVGLLGITDITKCPLIKNF